MHLEGMMKKKYHNQITVFNIQTKSEIFSKLKMILVEELVISQQTDIKYLSLEDS